MFEVRFHSAIPGWVKLDRLNIRQVPECEGGGFMIQEKQAALIMEAFAKLKNIHDCAAELWTNPNTANLYTKESISNSLKDEIGVFLKKYEDVA